MIRLLIDHRERHIAEKMVAICPTMISATTLTVGDFVFTTAGADAAVLLIIERKTLRDLADSIRDGRMENNEKLMTAQRVSGCRIAYLIEAADPYQSPGAKHGGITFGALTAKLDSLMLRFGVSVIWTRDTAHTIARISAMFLTFEAAIKKHGEPTLGGAAPERREGEPELAVVEEEKTAPRVAAVVQYVPQPPSAANMRISMLSCADGVNKKTAEAILARYNVSAILLGGVPAADIAAVEMTRGRIGPVRGAKIIAAIATLVEDNPAAILTAIHNISPRRAAIIVGKISMRRIAMFDYAPGAIADIADTVRRIGLAIETRIRAVFAAHV